MEKIVSKRHPVKFYGAILSLSLLAGFGLIFALTNYYNEYNEGELAGKDYPRVIMSIVFIIFAVYTIIRYLKNCPTITISKARISFNNREYKIEDIERVEFTGKQPFKHIGKNSKMEGAAIVFKNGEVQYLYDDLYINSALLKSVLDNAVNDKPMPGIANKPEEIFNEELVYFKGSFFLNPFGLMIILFTLMLLAIFLTQEVDVNTIIVLSSVDLLLIAISSGFFNYFGLNEKYFVVKNTIRFWKNDIYRIQDINDVMFQRIPKGAKLLKVTTNDYRSKNYVVTSLKEKDLKKLEQELIKQNINVRNDLP